MNQAEFMILRKKVSRRNQDGVESEYNKSDSEGCLEELHPKTQATI